MLEWNWDERKGIKYITVPAWTGRGVDIAFTGRSGGVSSSPFDSLNMGLHVGDSKDLVLENRNRVMQIFNQDISNMVCCQQIHSNQVAPITREKRGCGSADLNSCLAGMDGMVTNELGLYLATFYADCIPVYFFDPMKNCIGMVHSGWKGTMGRIAVNTVNVLEREFGCKRSDIEVFIGPGIGPCCFEVQSDLAAKAVSELGQFHDIIIKEKNNKCKWDLPQSIYDMLVDSGIKTENIGMARLCTSCHSEWFYSYRRENGITGRMGAFLGLRD